VRLLNILVYLAALITITLIVLRESISGWDILYIWPIAGFSLFNKSVLFSYLGMTGYKLLQYIKKFSPVKPTKLLWNMYLIIAMIGIYFYVIIVMLCINLDRDLESDKKIL
jgi:hypothetical protein